MKEKIIKEFKKLRKDTDKQYEEIRKNHQTGLQKLSEELIAELNIINSYVHLSYGVIVKVESAVFDGYTNCGISLKCYGLILRLGHLECRVRRGEFYVDVADLVFASKEEFDTHLDRFEAKKQEILNE